MKIQNTQGKRFYGMHFYPGVAEYSEPGKKPFRVFLNEDTIRSMDSSFEGKPVFVQHVDQVESNLDQLRAEVDGWVVKSFYNSADGKHWVEFIVCSERGLKAIEGGMRLSNAYLPKGPRGGQGLWNGVEYKEQIMEGEYEHLAIVPNPRYEESVILTPEEFKAYNAEKDQELKRIANSKTQGEDKMKLNFFKRTKVENELNLDGISVVLPTSKKEVAIADLVEKMDKIENMNGYCNMDHMVKVGNDEMSVNDLVKKHMDAMAKMEEMKKPKDGDEMENDEEEASTVSEGEKDVGDRGGDMSLENKEDDDKEEMKKEDEKKKNAIEKAARLKNAGSHLRNAPEAPIIMTSSERVALGKSLFGKN